MVLIFGGHGSGKLNFAKSLQGDGQIIIDHLEAIVWENLENAKNIVETLVKENPNAIIICDEIGCGLVPVEKIQREYRDVLGEITINLAKYAEKVFYVTLGIGVQIK